MLFFTMLRVDYFLHSKYTQVFILMDAFKGCSFVQLRYYVNLSFWKIQNMFESYDIFLIVNYFNVISKNSEDFAMERHFII